MTTQTTTTSTTSTTQEIDWEKIQKIDREGYALSKELETARQDGSDLDPIIEKINEFYRRTGRHCLYAFYMED